MRVLIIEDEQVAASHITALLQEIEPSIALLGVIDSVEDGLAQWPNLPKPDLIFSDIQLADGLSFSLLERVAVPCPIVFTTAYDEYAIRAFKLNSIDYLLKPIDRESLEASLSKFRSLNRPATDELMQQMQTLLSRHAFQSQTYRQTFLVQFRDKLIPIKVTDIAYFSIDGGVVAATLFAQSTDRRTLDYGISYPIDLTMEELDAQLDPHQFFRANRQFIVARNGIQEAELYFNGRLQLKLQPTANGPVLISKDRVTLFKKWMEAF
ncbi:LytTR family DNA-binding domain-containing protein [Spirosoma harenae]